MTSATAQPRASIVVRSMARPSLDAALASLAAQDVSMEVVVVAAGGSGHPALPAHCGPHALRLIGSEHRLGRPQAANRGLDAARGEWVGFLDDDDVFLPGHLRRLLEAADANPGSRWVYSVARGMLGDGTVRHFGRPFNLLQLHEVNFVHLSSALFDRGLVDAGCRFDESFDILEDWDFALQLAQHVNPVFVPAVGAEWRADAGDSGAGGGGNADERFEQFRERLFAKWSAPRDALVDRVAALLQAAAQQAQRGEAARAELRVMEALQASPNNPWALNLLAMLQRGSGRLEAARRTQELAVAVRPDDASLQHNLALLAFAQRDFTAARRCCDTALALSPGYPPALALRDTLSRSGPDAR